MRILVTGSAGFVGSHSADQLLAEGHEVIGVDNLRTGKRANLGKALSQPKFRFEQLDILESAALDGLVGTTRPQAILHLAALVSVQECLAEPDLGFSLNLLTTHLVAEAARKHAVPRVVFASSAAVYGDTREFPTSEEAAQRPLGPYGAAKLASEALLQGHAEAFGLSVFCLRYFNIYGPRQDASSPYSGVISAFDAKFRSRSRPVIYGDGLQTRDFISVHDVARANALAIMAGGEGCRCLNICTGGETSVCDLVGLFGRFSGHLGEPEMRPAREAEIKRSVGNPSRALNTIGFRAEVTVERGIEAMYMGPNGDDR